MDIMDNEKLMDVSDDVDKFLLDMAKKYETSALELTSIISARLYRLCEKVDMTNDYYDVLKYILELRSDSLNPMTIQ